VATKFKPPTLPFIGARHFGGKQTPKAIVLHGTVSSDNRGTARNIANWWHGPTSPVTSAHYVVDPAEVIQTVRDHTVAFHCGYNTGSIAIELCDEQTGPASRWADADSTAILRRAARLTAELCLAYDIEVKRPTVSELRKRGPHGIYGHNDSRLAFDNTTHTDPKDFPWAKFLAMVANEVAALKKPKTFKVLHAPLHGSSATKSELLRAVRRAAVVRVAFSEAYKHGPTLSRLLSWRAVIGPPTPKDSRGRLVTRDVILMIKRGSKHVDSGVIFGSAASSPLKIAPTRFITWSIDGVNGKPLAVIGLHPHAGVWTNWNSDRAVKYRRNMRRLEALVRLLRIRYGADLDIVVMGDLNYPNVRDGRHRAPRQVFTRLGMSWVSNGVDWVAFSKTLRLVDSQIIPKGTNGQDHPWLEVELERVV